LLESRVFVTFTGNAPCPMAFGIAACGEACAAACAKHKDAANSTTKNIEQIRAIKSPPIGQMLKMLTLDDADARNSYCRVCIRKRNKADLSAGLVQLHLFSGIG
jgi:hypothetical protein